MTDGDYDDNDKCYGSHCHCYKSLFRESMSFTRTKEDFVCEQCGACVTGDGYTNHCPQCLWSRHVDLSPGDRASPCGGAMEPVGLQVPSGGAWRIVHKCLRCGFIRAQNAAREDNHTRLIELSARPL